MCEREQSWETLHPYYPDPDPKIRPSSPPGLRLVGVADRFKRQIMGYRPCMMEFVLGITCSGARSGRQSIF